MARSQADSSVTLSVLDRLIDEDPRVTSEAPLSRAQSVRLLKAAVRRDLEWILNSRRVFPEPDESLRELEKSVYLFGLPDFTSFSMASMSDRVQLHRVLQATVKTFEPRMANVRITPIETKEVGSHTLRFRIEGLLLMDPSPEHVSFDTVLELTSGQCEVRGEADAG